MRIGAFEVLLCCALCWGRARCLADDLERIEIYNFHNGESHIGDVEVGYESEDA